MGVNCDKCDSKNGLDVSLQFEIGVGAKEYIATIPLCINCSADLKKELGQTVVQFMTPKGA